MTKKILLIIVIFLFNFSLKAQIELPYFQPFEDENFWDNEGNIGMQFATPNVPTGTDINASPCPSISFKECFEQRVQEAKGYSWDLSNNHQIDPNKHSLKLTVHNGDIPHMGTSIDGRTRSEINFITPNDNSLYIKWSLYIPNDGEFVETNIGTSYHKLFQLKPSGWDNENGVSYDIEPFNTIAALDITYSNDVSNKRDLYFWVDPPSIVRDNMNGVISDEYAISSNRKRMIIKDGIEKGAWNDIILKIEPSFQSNGYFQFWINQQPVVLDSTSCYTSSNHIPTVTYNVSLNSDTTLEPFKLFSENVVVTNDTNEPVPYGLKFGHYRKPQTNTQSMYIDALSITNGMPPFNSIETKLKNSFCDFTLPIENVKIECYEVPNATNYKFKFESISNNDEIWVNSQSPEIDLRNNSDLIPNMEYAVKVRAQGENFDFDYGDICNITIPKYTKLDPYNCNSTKYIGEVLSCYKIPGASQYKFRFTDSNNQNYWIDSSTNEVTIPDVSYFNQGGQFDVQVRELNHGYSEICTITIESDPFGRLTPQINKDSSARSLSLYPNPIDQYLNIPKFNENVTIDVYDLMGKHLYQKKIPKGENQVDLGKLQSGQYLLKIETAEETLSYKILKK